MIKINLLGVVNISGMKPELKLLSKCALTNQHACAVLSMLLRALEIKTLQCFSLVCCCKMFGIWLGLSPLPIMLCSQWYLSVWHCCVGQRSPSRRSISLPPAACLYHRKNSCNGRKGGAEGCNIRSLVICGWTNKSLSKHIFSMTTSPNM